MPGSPPGSPPVPPFRHHLPADVAARIRATAPPATPPRCVTLPEDRGW